VVGHAGLTFENGMLIPWPNIVENIWVNQSYMGIPIGKQIQIRTDLPKPKARVLRRAMALEITGTNTSRCATPTAEASRALTLK
jgi:ABC-type taurine transport system ATPase subunit